MITNKITSVENQNQIKDKVFDFTSRYKRGDILYYDDFNALTIETYDRKDYSKYKSYKFYMITKGAEFKPWLVSNDFYGDPGYWWMILESNQIYDVEDFIAGKTIKIYDITEVLS